jgi:hypothetical protein
MDINRTIRVISAQQSSDNAASLMKIVGPTLITSIPSNSFLWIYQPGKSPPVPAGSNVPYNPPDPRLSLSLDVQGPYERLQVPGDARPFYTGLRANPHDPERYTYALSVRPVPSSSPDQTLVDVSVVVFEDYDSTDPNLDPYPTNASLTRGQYALSSTGGNTPTRGVILDGQNGYVYRLAAGEVGPGPARADTSTIIVLPRAVEVLELGIISVR